MYLWIDYWTSNIGVAISEMGIAIPHRVFDHEEFFMELPELVEKRKVKTIVVWEASGYDAYGKQKKMYEKAIERIKKTVPGVVVEIQAKTSQHLKHKNRSEKSVQKNILMISLQVLYCSGFSITKSKSREKEIALINCW